MTKQPHKFADLIHAWADGEVIQCRGDATRPWKDCTGAPSWNEGMEYRIKPEPPKYPQTKMVGEEMDRIWSGEPAHGGGKEAVYRAHIALANAAIARAIQDGDVITLDEHNAEFAKVLYDEQHSTLSKVAHAFAEAMALESAKSTPGPGGYPLSDNEIASFAKTARIRIRKELAGIIVSVLGGKA